MKRLLPFFTLALLLSACSTPTLDLTQHFDANQPFRISDFEKPGGSSEPTEIQVGDPKHDQFIQWIASNNEGWEMSPHHSHAALIILHQAEFSLLFYRDNGFVVASVKDASGNTVQYVREMDANGLRFLVED